MNECLGALNLEENIEKGENRDNRGRLDLPGYDTFPCLLNNNLEYTKIIVFGWIGLHFVDAYLGTEVEPTGITGHEDDGEIPTPWTWIVEPRRPMSVTKWSGTLTHPNHHGDLIGATICAFVHFAYVYSHNSIVFADIQGMFNRHTTAER